MTARRIAALALFVVSAGLLWVALLTPIRSGEIAELDAEAQRLGVEWSQATSDGQGGNLLTDDDRAQELLEESNEAFAAARELEPPLAPLQATGGALLALAAGVALWPTSSGPDESTGQGAARAGERPPTS